MRYRVRHQTTYRYGEPVVISHNEARVSPRALAHQAVAGVQLDVDPRPTSLIRRRDYFGNEVVFFDLDHPHDGLTVVAVSDVTVAPPTPPDPEETPGWEEVSRGVGSPPDRVWLEAAEFLFDSASVRRGSDLARFAAPSFRPGSPVLAAVVDLSGRIFAEFRYDTDATHVATPVEEVLRDRRGVCQDFAHVMIGCLRSIGIPARYVSGYLHDPDSDLQGSHASHAWVSAFCGDAGWVDVDPTNDLLAGEGHVTLAWGRDYDDVPPLKGVTLGGRRHVVLVGVDVRPCNADSIAAGPDQTRPDGPSTAPSTAWSSEPAPSVRAPGEPASRKDP